MISAAKLIDVKSGNAPDPHPSAGSPVVGHGSTLKEYPGGKPMDLSIGQLSSALSGDTLAKLEAIRVKLAEIEAQAERAAAALAKVRL